MKNLETLIFDFGGVIYDIDIERSVESLKKLGLNHDQHSMLISDVFIPFEKGLLDETEVFNRVNSYTKGSLSKDDFFKAFLSVLIGLPCERVKYLKILKNKYRLYLLSNTCITHYNYFSAQILKDPDTSDFYNLFEKEYYSFDLKMRKPDPEIFEFIIKDSCSYPERTLFIDDSEENIRTAKSLGLQTYWMQSQQQWPDLLNMLNTTEI